MKFRLTYEGPLMGSDGGNTRARHKHEIRKRFHPQLMRLWELRPILARGIAWRRESGHPYPSPQDLRKNQLARENERFGYQFVPLILEELQVLCAINVLFLRPGLPGSLMRSADLDARLKTLFDALRIPKNQSELGGYDTPGEGEIPFYCLLEDDKLVSHVSIETDVLLESTSPTAGDHDARIVISVEMTPWSVTMANLDYG